jgi:hypothetical protein
MALKSAMTCPAPTLRNRCTKSSTGICTQLLSQGVFAATQLAGDKLVAVLQVRLAVATQRLRLDGVQR